MNFLLQLSKNVKDILLYPVYLKKIPFSSSISSLIHSINKYTNSKHSKSESIEVPIPDSLKQEENKPELLDSGTKFTTRKLSESTLDTFTNDSTWNEKEMLEEQQSRQIIVIKNKLSKKLLELKDNTFILKLSFGSQTYNMKFTTVPSKFT